MSLANRMEMVDKAWISHHGCRRGSMSMLQALVAEAGRTLIGVRQAHTRIFT